MGGSKLAESFIRCFRRMVECAERGKYELALLKLEEMIPVIPCGIGNDIFFTDAAEVLERAHIQRRIEVFADILDQGQLNRQSFRTDILMSETDAARIVAGVIRKFDIEEQWQIFRRLPQRYGSSVYDAFGVDKAKELSKREERDVLIELAESQELRHKEKAARKLELAPFDNSSSGVDDRWVPNALEERLVPKAKYDPEAQKAIAKLIAEQEFWPALLLNSDINVFYELLSKMLQEGLSYDDLKRTLTFSFTKPKLECELKSGWDELDVPLPRDEKELKKIRRLLRKDLVEGKYSIAWSWEHRNRKSKGLSNTVLIPLECNSVKPALAETLDVFKDKRLMAEFKFLTERAGIADPVPVKRDFHMPEIDTAEIPATKIMEDIEYTLVPIEPAEVLSSISRRNDALAAINGGFFVAQRSEFREGRSPIKSPLGLIIIDGKMVIPPTIKRATLLIDACGTPHVELVSMEDVEIKMGPPEAEKVFVCDRLCENQRGCRIPFYLAPFGVSVFNPRGRDVIVYTARFVNRVRGTNRTMSIRNRVEIGVLHNRVIFINEFAKKGSSIIPQNGFVISISSNSEKPKLKHICCWMKKLNVGDKVGLKLHTDCNLKCKNIVDPILQGIAGGPLLVKDDYYLKSEDFCYLDAELPCKYKEEFLPEYLFPTNIDEDWINNRHPRTAIGIKKTGKDDKRKVVYAVIDGDKNIDGDKKSFGMGVTTLARYLKCEGWLAGVLLDGGGSTELCIGPNTENRPSDGPPAEVRMVDQQGNVTHEKVERLLASGIVTIPKIPACPGSLQEACRLIIIKLVHDKMKDEMKKACKDRVKRMLSMNIFTGDFIKYSVSYAIPLVKSKFEEYGVSDRDIFNWNETKDMLSSLAKEALESSDLISDLISKQIDYSEFMDLLEWNKEVVFDNGNKGTLGAKVLKEVVFPALGDKAHALVKGFEESRSKQLKESKPQQTQEIQWFKEFYVCRKEISEIAGKTEKKEVRRAIEQMRNRFFDWLLKKMGVTDFSDKRAFCNEESDWRPLAEKVRCL